MQKQAEYEHLSGGEGKILIEFANGGHCAGITGSTYGDETHCGDRMIASYVRYSGRVGKVDTTCMNELPRLDFGDLEAIQQAVVGNVESADALYDSEPE